MIQSAFCLVLMFRLQFVFRENKRERVRDVAWGYALNAKVISKAVPYLGQSWFWNSALLVRKSDVVLVLELTQRK